MSGDAFGQNSQSLRFIGNEETDLIEADTQGISDYDVTSQTLVSQVDHSNQHKGGKNEQVIPYFW